MIHPSQQIGKLLIDRCYNLCFVTYSLINESCILFELILNFCAHNLGRLLQGALLLQTVSTPYVKPCAFIVGKRQLLQTFEFWFLFVYEQLLFQPRLDIAGFDVLSRNNFKVKDGKQNTALTLSSTFANRFEFDQWERRLWYVTKMSA